MAMPLAQDARQVLVHPLALVDAIERRQRRRVLVVLVDSTCTSAFSARSRSPRSVSKLAASRSSTSRRTAGRAIARDAASDIVVTKASHWCVARASRSSSSSACADDGIFLDRLGPPAEGRDLIDQLVLGDLGQPAQQRLPLVDVGQPTELHLVDLVQLLPLLARAIERLEHVGDLELHRAAHEHPLQRGARLGVGRVGGQDLAVGLDRLRQVHQRQLVDLRQPEGERDALVVGGGDAGSRGARRPPALPTAGRGCTADRARPAPACVLGVGLDRRR